MDILKKFSPRDDLDILTRNYELMFHKFMFFTCLTIIFYIPFFYLLGSTEVSICYFLLVALAFPLTFYFNRKKPHGFFKFLTIIWGCIGVYLPVVGFAQPGAGEYYYSSVLVSAVILFSKREKIFLYFSFIAIIFSWVLSNYLQYKIYDLTIHIKYISYENFRYLNFLGSTILSFILLRILLRSREELEEQKEKFFQNSKLASVGQLAAGVGHEINNPLAIANGYVRIIEQNLKKDNYKNEKVQEALEKYEIASDRIRKIVDGLRIYSRTNNVELENVDVVKLLNDSVSLVENIFRKVKVSLIWTKTDTALFVRVNTGKLNQVIMNLLSNAKDALLESAATEKKEIIINTSEDEEYIRISVKDNGIGISKEVQDKMFEQFFTTKDVGKGTGMGLSISHSIIKSFGGSIEVHSQEGKGSEFVIILPKVNQEI